MITIENVKNSNAPSAFTTNKNPIKVDKIPMRHVKMSELPAEDRPYEKFEATGEQSLTDTELLAILIKNGIRGMSAIHLASQIMTLDHKRSGVSFLCNIPVEDLVALPGIGKVKATIIKCALELGRRATRKKMAMGETMIKSPSDVVEYLKEEMQYLPCEELRVLLLDSKNIILRTIESSKGSVRETLFSPREIFKDALKYNAASIILIHNHPSGNPEPSTADIETTNELFRISNELNIQLLDHIVIARDGYTSIKAHISNNKSST